MKEILEAKLEELDVALKTASNWEYYLGQYTLCKELLSQCVHIECSYNTHDYDDDYYNDYYDEDWSVDEWSMHNDDMEHYKQEEIDNLYDVHYQHSWWIGKNVMNTDSYWFTSDEIEAFRVIWQRRLSA
jgi:hypothetical protein